MSVAIITGSAGLIGSEAVKFFDNLGMQVVGIDNDMRKFFFGEEASTKWNRDRLEKQVQNYKHYDVDIWDYSKIKEIFQHFGQDISLIIHTAAQPSHDWAASGPFSDFTVIDIPSILISPLRGFNRPKITSTKVVFPEPDLPINPINSPFLIIKEISSKARFELLGYLYVI